MGSYDPTSPKIDDGFIASDGENDVQGHVYKNGDDIPTELRADQGSGDGFRAAIADQEDDVEGHLRVDAEGGDEFRQVMATDESGDGFKSLIDQEDDVEGHSGAGANSDFMAMGERGDGVRSFAIPDAENDGGPEGFAAL